MTLECLEDGEVLTIGYRETKELYFQNPKFGVYFLELIGGRLLQKAERADERARAAELRAEKAEALLALTVVPG